VFTLRFSDEETLRKLKRTAAALGVSTTELAEAAIERELTLVGRDQELRLARALDRLRSAGPTDLDQDIQNFARAELEVEDPSRAYRVESQNQVQAGGSKVDEALTATERRLGVPTIPAAAIFAMIGQRLGAQPGIAAKVKTSFKFVLNGEGGGSWVLDLTEPPGRVIPDGTDALSVITTSATDFAEIVAGRLNPAVAVRQHRMKIEGKVDEVVLHELIRALVAG